MAQHQMVLPRALVYAGKQIIVFLDERLHQRLVVRRQPRRDGGQARVFRQLHQPREVALALLDRAAQAPA